MELRTGIAYIDRILQGGFKTEELEVIAANPATNTHFLKTIAINWKVDSNYALHYKMNGVDIVEYFKNSRELCFWKHLHEIYRKNKNQETEIVDLYMWDTRTNLPEKLVDIEIHFYQYGQSVLERGFREHRNKRMH